MQLTPPAEVGGFSRKTFIQIFDNTAGGGAPSILMIS